MQEMGSNDGGPPETIAKIEIGQIEIVGMPFKRDNESQLTYRLKWAAWEWLYNVAQCRNIGVEVRLEGPSSRVVDLAAVGPGNTVYVGEVKASRSDFARDNHTREDLVKFKGQKRQYSTRTELARDTLIQAASFARSECSEAWREVPAYRHALTVYRRMVRNENSYDNRLASYSIKFHDDRFMGIADYHYIIAPANVVNRRLLPPGWGLLADCARKVVAAPRKTVRKNTGIVSNVLRAICRSNTTSMMRAQGVLFTQEGVEFPGRRCNGNSTYQSGG